MTGQCMINNLSCFIHEKDDHSKHTIRVYKKRFFVLFLFCLYSMVNSFQWIQYAGMNDTFRGYYGVPATWINWTSIIFMVVYIPLILPANWLLELIGLRYCVILGSMGTTFGACVKIFGLERNGFYIAMIGQTIVAISQLYVISIPPALASVWFPDHQVSTATAIGVFANQLGVGLGLIVPQAFVSNNLDTDLIKTGSYTVFYSVGLLSGLITLLIVIFFYEPPYAPGKARLKQINKLVTHRSTTYKGIIWKLFRNKHFVYLFISYGIFAGLSNAMSTVLSQLLAPGFHDQLLIGKVGMITTIAGMFGAILSAHVLDRFPAYKMVTILMYIFTLVSIVVSGYAIETQQVFLLYCASAFLGFFQNGYLPVGFGYAAEITHPISENTSASLLNMSTQIFGVAITYTSGILIEIYGDVVTHLFFLLSVIVCILLTVLIQAEMRRHNSKW